MDVDSLRKERAALEAQQKALDEQLKSLDADAEARRQELRTDLDKITAELSNLNSQIADLAVRPVLGQTEQVQAARHELHIEVASKQFDPVLAHLGSQHEIGAGAELALAGPIMLGQIASQGKPLFEAIASEVQYIAEGIQHLLTPEAVREQRIEEALAKPPSDDVQRFNEMQDELQKLQTIEANFKERIAGADPEKQTLMRAAFEEQKAQMIEDMVKQQEQERQRLLEEQTRDDSR
ncbi:hypothetical protein [Aquabacterium sp.]|uniref:hypothetical protein n=1 Tax=Aquabacterium sp. TaxID=1872578 RepID=UPI00248A2A31|nr:hypothetical protein [Aquabacterium sp.]MDI1260080.1 hypothetical protein [Aquabacterium sp.]